jgi:hypothetical protein
MDKSAIRGEIKEGGDQECAPFPASEPADVAVQ